MAVVIICGTEYPTIKAASVALQLPIDTIRLRLKSSVDRWSEWTRKDTPKQSHRSRGSREVMIDDVRYASINLAAKALGLTFNTVYGRCESTSVKYAGYRFIDREPTRRRKRLKGVVVMMEGRSYDTLAAAAKIKGVHSMTLSRKMGHPRYPTYYYADRKTKQRINHGTDI